MSRVSLTNLLFITCALLIFLLLLYLTQPPPPSLLRYRRQGGPFPGYKDCVPANQLVFLDYTTTKYSRVVHNILGRMAVNMNLSYNLEQNYNCSRILLGFTSMKNKNSKDFCDVKNVRDIVGEEPYIVTLIGEDVKETEAFNEIEPEEADKIIDLAIISTQLKESLIVLKQLLCLNFRDIAHVEDITEDDHISKNKNKIYKFFATKLENIIEELGKDEIAKAMSIVEHANHNLRTICNQTNPERYAGVNARQLLLCKQMEMTDTDFSTISF